MAKPKVKKRIISVFGSGHIEENFSEYQRAALLGRVLAEHGFTICTGGYGGIMEAAPRGAKQVGGKTLGIVARELGVTANRWIDRVRIERTWRERLMRLVDVADGFVIFDGGTGTLTELFIVWEMVNKRLIQKPIIIHGASMVAFVRNLKKQRLVFFNDSLKIAPSPASVVDYLEDAFEEQEAEER